MIPRPNKFPAPFSSASVRPIGTIPLQRFAFLGDPILLRDARALGQNPSLRVHPETGDLFVFGTFTMLQRFTILPEEGRDFVETSGDENPIHTEDSVVPGAMTAARFLLAPEILLQGLAAMSLKVKFRAFARYDRPSVNVFVIRPVSPSAGVGGGPGETPGPHLSISAKCYQLGTLIADATILARFESPSGAQDAGAGIEAIESESAASAAGAIPPEPAVRKFLASVRVDPDRYLKLLGFRYPRAFLAALPSGAMVRRGGSGGLLNVLDLEFGPSAAPSLLSQSPPVAEVESGRPRSSFRKVLARVSDGIRTYCKGTATVLLAMVRGAAGRKAEPGAAAQSESSGTPVPEPSPS